MNEEEWEVGCLVLHAQIEEEIAIVGAASIKNRHGGAGTWRSLPPLLAWVLQSEGAEAVGEHSIF
jgi:hypothetical protein